MVESGGWAVKLKTSSAMSSIVAPLEQESQSHNEALRTAHTELLEMVSRKVVSDTDLARFTQTRAAYLELRSQILRLIAPAPKPKAKPAKATAVAQS